MKGNGFLCFNLFSLALVSSISSVMKSVCFCFPILRDNSEARQTFDVLLKMSFL